MDNKIPTEYDRITLINILMKAKSRLYKKKKNEKRNT